MKAIELLTRQHTEVISKCQRARRTLGDEQVTLLAEIARALLIHMAIEEQHLYPAYRKYGLPEAADESIQEHNEARDILRELMNLPQNDAGVLRVLDRLDLAVRSHAGKEEGELFPWVRARVPDAVLDDIGNAMERQARSLLEERDFFSRMEQAQQSQPQA